MIASMYKNSTRSASTARSPSIYWQATPGKMRTCLTSTVLLRRCWTWINRCSIIWNSRLKSACQQETNHAWVPEEITQQEIWGLGEHCLEDIELFMMWRIPVSFCGIVPYQCRGTCWTLKFHGKHSHSVSGLVSGLSAITSTLLCDHLA